MANGPLLGAVGHCAKQSSASRALLLLVSLLGGLFLSLRGIEDILVLIGGLLAAGLVARIAKRRQPPETPYRSQDRPQAR